MVSVIGCWTVAICELFAGCIGTGWVMSTPAIGPATVGLSGLELFSVSQPASAVSATARQVTERQMEQAAFLVMRLRAQAKGEIDALRRAAHEGKFALPRWNQVSAIAFTRKSEADGGEARDAGGKSSSRNALIPVEPWRCRLPAVKSDRVGDQFLMGAISRAPTEASRSS